MLYVYYYLQITDFKRPESVGHMQSMKMSFSESLYLSCILQMQM